MPSQSENEFVNGMWKVVEGEKRSRPDMTMRHNDGNVQPQGSSLDIRLPSFTHCQLQRTELTPL
jgi:hypothetical protein